VILGFRWVPFFGDVIVFSQLLGSSAPKCFFGFRGTRLTGACPRQPGGLAWLGRLAGLGADLEVTAESAVVLPVEAHLAGDSAADSGS